MEEGQQAGMADPVRPEISYGRRNRRNQGRHSFNGGRISAPLHVQNVTFTIIARDPNNINRWESMSLGAGLRHIIVTPQSLWSGGQLKNSRAIVLNETHTVRFRRVSPAGWDPKFPGEMCAKIEAISTET